MRVRVDERQRFTALLVALIALAWLGLWAGGRSPAGRFLAHEHQAHGGPQGAALLFTSVAGWGLMTVAMMLPTSLPLLTMFHALTRQRPDRARLVALLIAGYLAVWTLFGLLAQGADRTLHRLVDSSATLQAHAALLGAAILALAGLYQFTPLKYLCLDRCRSPLTFIVARWRGGAAPAQALRLGLHHGLFCLGCCWSLMLLMFAVGVGNLGWMLGLGAIMAAEKNLPWGRRLSAPLGATLLGWGLLLALQEVAGG